MKKGFVYGMVVFCLSFLLMSCKLTISTFTAPSTANTGEIIILTINGDADSSGGECGLVLQIPENWEVISDSESLSEKPQYAALYTAPSGYKIWVGTRDTASSSWGGQSVSEAVRILTGRTPVGSVGTVQNYNLKIAAGAFRNGAWVTDDPANVYDFSQITGDKYSKSISITTSATDSAPPAPVSQLVADDTHHTGTDINLTWGYDEAAQKDMVKYRIYQSTANFTNVSAMAYVGETPAGTFSYDAANLTPGTTYYFAVTALDEVSNENKTVTTVSATPLRKVGSLSVQSYYSDCTFSPCTDRGIAGAKITAINNSFSNIRTTVTSDSAGNFTLGNLPIGTYTITIEAYGYGSTSYYSIEVLENQTVPIPNQNALSPNQIGLSGNLAFGNVYVGSSGTRTLTISNLGTTPLSVSSLSYPLGFSSNWSSGTIPAGSSQSLNITFSPTSAKVYSGNVYVSSSQPSNYILISGTGIKSAIVYYTIFGSVKTASGTAISGVTMTLSTGPTTTTDSSGNYSFSNIVAGSGAAVTPSRSGYTFTPTSQSFSNISANQSLNFTGASISSYTISGSVKDSNNTGVSGVLMTFGNSGGTASSDSTGFYSKSVSSGWSGTLRELLKNNLPLCRLNNYVP